MTIQTISVGVDWGSSSFRAYRYDASGEVIDQLDSQHGIKTVSNNQFEEVLFSQVGDWLKPNDVVLLSGMITSRNGWLETPYIDCPFHFGRLLQPGSIRKKLGNNITAVFLPGACMSNPADVMRGEELQLRGAVQSAHKQVVLPGTHSKWALVNERELETFHTVVTGELFDVLINQTLVGSLASSREYSDDAFAEGVKAGYKEKAIITRLFTARSGVLLESLSPDHVYSYLSGLLIGNEIKESRILASEAPVLIIGSGTLTARYSRAFELLGIASVVEARDAAALGFQKLIKQYLESGQSSV